MIVLVANCFYLGDELTLFFGEFEIFLSGYRRPKGDNEELLAGDFISIREETMGKIRIDIGVMSSSRPAIATRYVTHCSGPF